LPWLDCGFPKGQFVIVRAFFRACVLTHLEIGHSGMLREALFSVLPLPPSLLLLVFVFFDINSWPEEFPPRFAWLRAAFLLGSTYNENIAFHFCPLDRLTVKPFPSLRTFAALAPVFKRRPNLPMVNSISRESPLKPSESMTNPQKSRPCIITLRLSLGRNDQPKLRCTAQSTASPFPFSPPPLSRQHCLFILF